MSGWQASWLIGDTAMREIGSAGEDLGLGPMAKISCGLGACLIGWLFGWLDGWVGGRAGWLVCSVGWLGWLAGGGCFWADWLALFVQPHTCLESSTGDGFSGV